MVTDRLGGDRPFLVGAVPQSNDKHVVFRVKEDGNGGFALSRQVVVGSIPDDMRGLLASLPVAFEQPHNYDAPPPSRPLAGGKSGAPSHFSRSVTVINSQTSGVKAGSQLYFTVLGPLLNEFGISHVYVATDSSDSIPDHAASFSTSSTVIILGGDTSIHEFVNSLPESHALRSPQLTLCIVPCGTGNALASSVGLKTPLEAVQRLFIAREVQALTTFRVDFPPGSYDATHANETTESRLHLLAPLSYYAIVVASWGFHSALVAESDSPEMRKLGIERFSASARKLAQNKQEYHGSMSTGDGDLGPSHSYLLVTSMTHLEPTFKISPRGVPPSTGKLFLVYVPALEGGALIDIMMQVYDHSRHIDSPHVTYKELDSRQYKITVADQSADNRRWCVDGRIVACAPGNVTLHASSRITRGWVLGLLC